MGVFSELFNEELVFLDYSFRDQHDFFQKISSMLYEKGYVKSSFYKAISQREEKYPTGLRIEPFHVAIPHTDPSNIVRPFIAVVRPDHTIEFNEMGMANGKVEAQFLFVLGLNKGEGQAELLSKLVNLFSNKEVMSRLMEEKEENQIIQLIKENID
ncbi:PTS sugar transporter subunit IIA [Fervidibacillus halotolerans]|uniref:PTS sugar transporter subunit IIA n=1 Tax=Fervidibacillus halotolerans TaxID=2980027 RepID=A0A9E8S0L2_9BACI|nr:PTS sugar transporter subunit IIA [Fervidibacillus halotolerans]WAA12692.1 PTS sugar transporter subunit IIA [Fervidibacillus halotolerans]